MRKRLVIVGHSREAIELVPMLESNPEVEILALVTDQPDALREGLARLDSHTRSRLTELVSSDLAAVLKLPDITAAIDAGDSPEMREQLAAAPDLQVTTPILAQLLYAFGPADALSKSDLLQALREVLDSYNLTLDRRELLNRVLQIAVTVTGADRGSLMLWDEQERALRVAVARGIEEELIDKIRVGIGEGIAGRAFATQRAILLHGKANDTRYEIVRERDDVESAISAPLLHGGTAIGVLNLSHARDQEAFSEEDLYFVRDLAQLDAKLIARADIYHGLLEESESLRVEVQVRRLVAGRESLSQRLEDFCRFAAAAVPSAVCRLYLCDPELDSLVLQASSTGLDPLTARRRVRMSEGIAGTVAATRRPVWLRESTGDAPIAYSAIPMLQADQLLGVLELEGGSATAEPHGHAGRLAAAASALADQLAEIIEAARATRQSRRTESVSDLFSALTLQRDRDEAYDLVTSSTAAVLEAEDVVLRVLGPTGDAFEIVSWTGVGQSRLGRVEAVEAKLSSHALDRRAALRIADLASDPDWAAEGFGSMSALCQPLQSGGRLVGCLTVLGLVPAEPVLGQTFQRDDELLLARLAEQVQVALFALESANATDTSDPIEANGARLRARVEDEIARSSHAGREFALLQLHFDGLAPILAALPDAEADRWMRRLHSALAAGLRRFDLLIRTAEATFRVLVPDPDEDAATLLVALSQRANSMLRGQGSLADPVHVRTGYAVFPSDGEDRETLERRADATANEVRPGSA